jgi:hypothetical protein
MAQIQDFLLQYGYKEDRREIFAQGRKGGTYYDIIFKSRM